MLSIRPWRKIFILNMPMLSKTAAEAEIRVKIIIEIITVSAQIEQRCSNFHKRFFGAVAFKFGKSAVIIKMLL